MKLSFNYYDINEWSSYIKEFIIPIREKAYIILQFWDYLLDHFHSKSISEFKNDENILNKLLGGITINGDYKERSAAKFYKTFFGWEIENIVTYLKNKENEIEIDTTIGIKKTALIEFITDLLNQCKLILDIAYDKDLISTTRINTINIDFDSLIKSDEKIIKLIGELYKSINKFSVLYSEKTLFLWTLRKNTKRYLKFQYEQIDENNEFNILQKIFDFDIYFSPNLDEKSDVVKEINEEYTIWYFREKGLGDEICKLNEFIFERFDEQLLSDFQLLINNVKNFEKEYFEYINMKLNFWNFPNYIDTKEYGKYGYHYEYLIEGVYLPHSFKVEYSFPELYNKDFNISYLKLLDDLAPGLFLNKIKPENLIVNKRKFNDHQKIFIRIKE